MNIKDYGFKSNLIGSIDNNKMIARIIATHKDSYEIVCNNGHGFAKIKRGYYYDNPNSIYPTTGDFVLIEWNALGDSMIYETLKRESSFLEQHLLAIEIMNYTINMNSLLQQILIMCLLCNH